MDLEFVDPTSGATLGPHAFGTVAAGATSAAFSVALRYAWGRTGFGLRSLALVLAVEDPDAPGTWRTDLGEFLLQVTEIRNPALDPIFIGAVTPALRVSRLSLPPLRAGTAYVVAVTFAPTFRRNRPTTAYTWRLEAAFDEAATPAPLPPGTRPGVLTGLEDGFTDWAAAPSLTLGTDEITLGPSWYVAGGRSYRDAGGAVALSQEDGDGETLATGQEYLAALTMPPGGPVTVNKGLRAVAGLATLPSLPWGEIPLALVRVPAGAEIVSATAWAVSGRLALSAGPGLAVTVAPGRARLRDALAHPPTEQVVPLEDESTSRVYLTEQGVAATISGPPPGWLLLGEVTTTGGSVSGIVDHREILGPPPLPLFVAGAEAVAEGGATAFVPFRWTLDRAELRVRAAAAGATGTTDVSVSIDGTPILAASLPAGDLSAAAAPTVTVGDPGWLALDVAAVTAGGTPAEDVLVLLHLSPVAA